VITVYAHTLEATIGQMYRLMHQYRNDVRSTGWRNIREVYEGVKHVPYRRDETAAECLGAAECVKRPGLTLVLGGDCDDKVILAGAALLNLGVPFRVVTTSYLPSGEMQHTYLEIYVDGVWLPFDPTYQHNNLGQEANYTHKLVWA